MLAIILKMVLKDEKLSQMQLYVFHKKKNHGLYRKNNDFYLIKY